MNLDSLFQEAIARHASDIHLATGEVPRLRIAGDLVRLDLPVVDRAALEEMLSLEALARLESGQSVERTVTRGDFGFVGVFLRTSEEDFAATFRILSGGIPTLDCIGDAALPMFQRLVDAPRGLALITGVTGSGKWTTACSVADAINERKPSRIFVIESHPNYLFASKAGMVTQIHVSRDTEGYARALDFAFHADLDVVVVDDIPTLDTLRTMLLLAETGHLVIANLHAESALGAVRKLLDDAGVEAEALQKSFAANFLVVTGQKLFPRLKASGRAVAYEWIAGVREVRQAMAAGDLSRLAQIQATDPECRTADASERELAEAGEIAHL